MISVLDSTLDGWTVRQIDTQSMWVWRRAGFEAMSRQGMSPEKKTLGSLTAI